MSESVFKYYWDLFIYDYLNGWCIILICIIAVYFFYLRKQYTTPNNTNNIIEKYDSNNDSTINMPSNTLHTSNTIVSPLDKIPQLAQLISNSDKKNESNEQNEQNEENIKDEESGESTESIELTDDISIDIKRRLDIAVSTLCTDIMNEIDSEIGATQDKNRPIYSNYSNVQLRSKIEKMITNKADVLYSELPHIKNKTLKKSKIVKYLKQHIPSELHDELNTMVEQANSNIKKYNILRDKIANYGIASGKMEMRVEMGEYTAITARMKLLQSEIDKTQRVAHILNGLKLFPKHINVDVYNQTGPNGQNGQNGQILETFANDKNDLVEPSKYENMPNYLDEIKKKETDQTRKYGEAYRKYMEEIKKQEMNVNPIELLSRFENNIIKMLENLQNLQNINTKPTVESTAEQMYDIKYGYTNKNNMEDSDLVQNVLDRKSVINRKSNTSNMGDYLVDKDVQKQLLENFESSSNDKSNKNSSKNAKNAKNAKNSNKTDNFNIVQDVINYISSTIVNIGVNNDMFKNLWSSITFLNDENENYNDQLMSFGFIIVLISIFLMLIEFTS